MLCHFVCQSVETIFGELTFNLLSISNKLNHKIVLVITSSGNNLKWFRWIIIISL